MKRKINYRAERAERTRKKAEKKAARVAALNQTADEKTATKDASVVRGSTPNVHRFSD